MRRRDFIKVIAGSAAAWPIAVRAQQTEMEKLSKAQAQYQDSPRGIAMCATCTLFIAPRACKVVDGDIMEMVGARNMRWRISVGISISDRYSAKAIFRKVA